MRNLEEFNQKHVGRKAYILGAGPSLATMDLGKISDGVVLAINAAYMAHPESDYFLSDDWTVSGFDYFYDTLANSDHTIGLLYEETLGHAVHMLGSRSVIFRHRRNNSYHITDRYEHDVYDNHICQARSSVGSAIHVAHIMGCDPIILLGVDGTRVDGCRYFWQMPGSKWKAPVRQDDVNLKRFMTVSRALDGDLQQISDYWKMHGHEFNKKCHVFNASPISTIDVFPKWRIID